MRGKSNLPSEEKTKAICICIRVSTEDQAKGRKSGDEKKGRKSAPSSCSPWAELNCPEGEVAKMLDVSRTTIYKYFENGILWGKIHFVTGWRKISRDSIEVLAEKLGITVTDIKVFPSAADKTNRE